MAQNQLDDNEDEKEYEKVLDHVRLSNDSFKPHTEKYYAKKMNDFAEKGNVTNLNILIETKIKKYIY